MKNLTFALKFALPLLLILFAADAARAQQPQTTANQLPQPKPAALSVRKLQKRPGLLELLNLSAEQVQQIRRISRETRDAARAANQRVRQSRRALDAAIYADAPDNAEVEQRARELADAQFEAIKTRAAVELRIRQILTPEQLTQFRSLRAQFQR